MNELTILNTTKKLLGIDPTCDAFDVDIQAAINTALLTLHQLGVGPEKPFSLLTGEETWSELTTDQALANQLKTYIYLKVRLMFDPPSTSFVIDAINKNIQEIEWRLNFAVETKGVEDM